MNNYKCVNCAADFKAKESDRKIGRALFCSKSCASKYRAETTKPFSKKGNNGEK